MAEHDEVMVPYVSHEADMMRADMMHRRLLKIIILLIVMLVVSNAAWLIAWQSYDYESYEIKQDGEGMNIVGDDNKEIYIGPDGQSQKTNKEGQQG